MNCKKAEKLLIDYLYQELSAKKTLAVEKHLQTCEKCTKTAESWRAIHQGFHRAAEDEPSASPYLKQKLLIAAREELDRKQTFAERFMGLLKPVVLLPIVIFAIATILYFPWKSRQKMEIAQFSPARKVAPAGNQELLKAEQTKTGTLTDYDLNKKKTDELQSYRNKDASFSYREQPKQAAKSQNLSQSQRDKLRGLGYISGREEKRATPTEPSPASPAPVAPPSANEPEATNAQMAARPQIAQEVAPEAQPTVMSKAEAKETGDSYFQEAQSSFQQNDLKNGQRLNQQAVEHDGARSLAGQFYQTGIQYQQNRDCEKAILQFSMVVNNYRDYSGMENVLLRLGDCYAEIGQIQAAKKIYTQLLQYSSSKQIATQKIQEIDKKIQTQEQLKALGYVSQ